MLIKKEISDDSLMLNLDSSLNPILVSIVYPALRYTSVVKRQICHDCNSKFESHFFHRSRLGHVDLVYENENDQHLTRACMKFLNR